MVTLLRLRGRLLGRCDLYPRALARRCLLATSGRARPWRLRLRADGNLFSCHENEVERDGERGVVAWGELCVGCGQGPVLLLSHYIAGLWPCTDTKGSLGGTSIVSTNFPGSSISPLEIERFLRFIAQMLCRTGNSHTSVSPRPCRTASIDRCSLAGRIWPLEGKREHGGGCYGPHPLLHIVVVYDEPGPGTYNR